MRLRRHIVAASAAAAMVALFAIEAAADSNMALAYSPSSSPWSLAPGEYYTELAGSSYATSTAFTSDAKKAEIGGKEQLRAFRSFIDLGWKKHLSFQLSLPMVTNTKIVPAQSLTTTALENIGVGFRWKLGNGAQASALQFRWEAPTGYDPKLPLPPGDGRQTLSAALLMGRPLGQASMLQAGIGYGVHFRNFQSGKNADGTTSSAADTNWTDQVLFNAAAARWFGHLQVAALSEGAFRGPHKAPMALVSVVSVGPRLTYHVDERLDAFAGSWHSLWGRNTLRYDEFYAGIGWRSTKLSRLQGFLGGDKRP